MALAEKSGDCNLHWHFSSGPECNWISAAEGTRFGIVLWCETVGWIRRPFISQCVWSHGAGHVRLVQNWALGSQGNIVMEQRIATVARTQKGSCLLLREGVCSPERGGPHPTCPLGSIGAGADCAMSHCHLAALCCWPGKSQLCWSWSYLP